MNQNLVIKIPYVATDADLIKNRPSWVAKVKALSGVKIRDLKLTDLVLPANQPLSAAVKHTIASLERLFVKHYKSQSGILVLNR